MAQPRQIGDVLAQLIARRGYARQQSTAALQSAWEQVAGEFATVTRAGNLSRGTLEILVSNNLLAQELGFQTDELIARLQKLFPASKINKLRFRVGSIS
jgi:hypothetical protein